MIFRLSAEITIEKGKEEEGFQDNEVLLGGECNLKKERERERKKYFKN